MPEGMFLKSQGFASNLSDPGGTHTLAAYCRATGKPYADYGLPVPLATFIGYGRWFADELVPELEETLVTAITPVATASRWAWRAGRRPGPGGWWSPPGSSTSPHAPDDLAGLPAALCTHSSAHTDLSSSAGSRSRLSGQASRRWKPPPCCTSRGRGPDRHAGARVAWNGAPLAPDRPFRQRIAEPEAGLGSGWTTWFYSRHPGLFRYLPEATRVHRARTALGPAGASWLRPRVEGTVPILAGQTVSWAKAGSAGVALGLAGRDGGWQELVTDHVIAATGYRADLRRLAFLGDQLRSRLRTVASTPAVGGDYQSSVPGPLLHRPRRRPDIRAGHALRLRRRPRRAHGRPAADPALPAARRQGWWLAGRTAPFRHAMARYCPKARIRYRYRLPSGPEPPATPGRPGAPAGGLGPGAAGRPPVPAACGCLAAAGGQRGPAAGGPGRAGGGR